MSSRGWSFDPRPWNLNYAIRHPFQNSVENEWNSVKCPQCKYTPCFDSKVYAPACHRLTASTPWSPRRNKESFRDAEGHNGTISKSCYRSRDNKRWVSWEHWGFRMHNDWEHVSGEYRKSATKLGIKSKSHGNCSADASWPIGSSDSVRSARPKHKMPPTDHVISNRVSGPPTVFTTGSFSRIAGL